jgi:hypothetical protein
MRTRAWNRFDLHGLAQLVDDQMCCADRERAIRQVTKYAAGKRRVPSTLVMQNDVQEGTVHS